MLALHVADPDSTPSAQYGPPVPPGMIPEHHWCVPQMKVKLQALCPGGLAVLKRPHAVQGFAPGLTPRKASTLARAIFLTPSLAYFLRMKVTIYQDQMLP